MGKVKLEKKKCCAKYRKKGKPCSRCPLFASGCSSKKKMVAVSEIEKKKDKKKNKKKKK
ncbi:hypothetical protein [Desulfogranum marinum]|uniref:hypothetical protein n=1 Tax=Desulfogranum marinum TaxID=453220 RepID=UPI001965E22A|nr:hypothetical protein [Desulfogranum marinum]MBM9512302.1 hypothetical protein [Desulfogranum marinum]